MSTNDTVIALANGGPARRRSSATAPTSRSCRRRWPAVRDLARAIAADGEGATKLLIVDVAGAPERAMARDLARAVAGGSLVKSGIFGGDPSWGRILAALGARVGARDLPLDPVARDARHPGRARLRQRRPIAFDARRLSALHEEGGDRGAPRSGRGKESARALGCDLTFDYVKINAEYYTARPARREAAKRPPVGATGRWSSRRSATSASSAASARSSSTAARRWSTRR
jgi:acetylglutamate kinase